MAIDSSPPTFLILCMAIICLMFLAVVVLVIALVVKKANSLKVKTGASKKGVQPSRSVSSTSSVGAASQQVGFDVRELKMMGFRDDEMFTFTKEEIASVVNGKYSLTELRKRKGESS